MFTLLSHGVIPGTAECAEVKEHEVTTLDPVIVTGSSQPISIHQPTQSLTVITSEEITPLRPNRVVNILQHVPGIHLDEMSGRGGISSLYLRGADPNFTLVMLDGIPLNDPTNRRGGSVDLSTIPIEHISRVEIVRGPSSALYGSEAMAGVINFITHPPESKPYVRLLGEAGRFQALKGGAHAGGKVGLFDTALSFSHEQNDAQVDMDDFSQTSIGWNIALNPESNWKAQLTGQYADSRIHSFPEGSGGPDLALLRETERRDTQQFLLGFTSFLNLPSDWDHQLFVSYSHRNHDVESPGILATPTTFALPPSDTETTYDRFQLRLTETWHVIQGWLFTIGGQFTHEEGKQDGEQDLSSLGGPANASADYSLSRKIGGLFSEITWNEWTPLLLNSGIRFDFSEDFEPNINPRIQASYQLAPLWQMRGGYGEGFKLPALASLGDPIIGNPDLQPELSRGWDLGLQFTTLDTTFQATLTFFHNRFRDLIDLDPQLLNQGIFRLTNLDHVTTKGLELGMTASPFSNLSLQASMTYLQTRVDETGDDLRNRPKWRGSVAITYHMLPSLTIRGQLTSISSREDFQVPTQVTQVDGYTKADLTVLYTPFPGWKGFAAFENISNSSYEDFKGFSAPPMIFRFGLEYSSLGDV